MFGRVITAMATPFDRNGALDLERARGLAEHLVANGSAGLGLAGAAGDLAGTARLVAEKPDDFTIWSGDDALTLPMLSLGAHGVISVASHLVGSRLQEQIAAHSKGDADLAAAINRELVPLFDVLFIT